jgi:hypothetical protein
VYEIESIVESVFAAVLGGVFRAGPVKSVFVRHGGRRRRSRVMVAESIDYNAECSCRRQEQAGMFEEFEGLGEED